MRAAPIKHRRGMNICQNGRSFFFPSLGGDDNAIYLVRLARVSKSIEELSNGKMYESYAVIFKQQRATWINIVT